MDGTCQPWEARCDCKNDCRDKSDEENCTRVSKPDNYDAEKAPTGDGHRPLPLYLTVDILSFDQIDMLRMSIALTVRLNLTWKDGRLSYNNLRDDVYSNGIGPGERSGLWLPEIGLANAKIDPLVKDDHVTWLIRKDSKPLPIDLGAKNRVYSGQNNTLMRCRRYAAEYPCTFNLRFFPFDRQTCTMIFKMRTATEKSVVLIPDGVKYNGPSQLIEFVVKKVNISKKFGPSRSELWMEIMLERDYLYHLSQSFFQSFLLSFLAYSTFWIDVDKFSERFIGSLTCLLVLTSLMAAMMHSLPNTAYFKAIDIWLLFFLSIDAFTISMHVCIDALKRKMGPASKLNSLMKIAIPIFFVAFSTLFSLAVLYQ